MEVVYIKHTGIRTILESEVVTQGVHYIYFGYGDVPSGRVSVFQNWYKERYQFSQFWYKELYLFSRFLDEIYKVGYTFTKNWYKVGYVFAASMARPRPKSGQVHPPRLKLNASEAS